MYKLSNTKHGDLLTFNNKLYLFFSITTKCTTKFTMLLLSHFMYSYSVVLLVKANTIDWVVRNLIGTVP